ncbi:4Fe-4S dicluster domain-containing protein [Natronorubrum sp. JWXQ-INN-674]|uniref:4Fe-4S dicluster domain-containing protein n=1 Tax=Natronorubrum halalkaliphilum TaxID=2691917 RepID=A0A6B0VT38_9EURY|nr:4Fe-4S ferredoxin N-terminal domain-containing protein [Natronorubrum halalkaliphilum]MXV64323.1 4Fe-4S dicluster domain-containing protein [Natronorubrum halalkaliphilum]
MSTDDESFHPLGQEWETELEGMLDETEYDSDLGMQMAQDAMRVTKGELSEAEFHEKYHDDVMEEFDVDDRPTKEAYEQAQEEQKGTATRMLEAFDGEGEETRRDTMKKMGLGAAAVGFGAWGVTDDGPEMNLGAAQEGDEDGDGDDGTQLGMVLDLERCDGCLSCVTACSEENQLDQGVNWMYILDYEEPGEDGGRSRNRLIRPCQHCTDAPCEKVCPTTARHTRDKDGLVLTDYDVCIGCRYCQVACPYGVNYFQWDEPDVSTDEIEEMHSDMDGDHMTSDEDRWVDSRAPRGTMSKCTMCPTRQDGHMGDEMVGTTACEEACPPDAINFGDMNDPDSRPRQYLSNVVQSRAEHMIADESPNREDVEEAYAFLDGEIELLDMQYLDGDWDRSEIEGVMYLNDEIETADLEYLIDAEEYDSTEEAEEAAAEALREVVIAVLENEFEVGDDDDDELSEDDLETLVDAILGDASEDDVDSDDFERATDALDAVITSSEESIQDVVDRYESREITPAEVEESLLILREEEEEPWVSEAGITDEDTAQQVIESYAGDESSTFKLLEDMGTNPNVTYIGNEPGPSAEQVDGPVAYEQVGLTDNRKEVLDESTVGDTGMDLGGW